MFFYSFTKFLFFFVTFLTVLTFLNFNMNVFTSVVLAIKYAGLCSQALTGVKSTHQSRGIPATTAPQSTTLTSLHFTACTVDCVLEFCSDSYLFHPFPHTWFPSPVPHPIPATVIRAVKVSTFDICDYTVYYTAENHYVDQFAKHVHWQVTVRSNLASQSPKTHLVS